jgi:peptide/nickel transport system ATP-binding protein
MILPLNKPKTAVPKPEEAAGDLPVLDVKDLTVSYRVSGGFQRAVEGVSFSVGKGEVTALVGESGSGKTSAAQAIIGLLPGNGRVEGGQILLNGTDIARWPQRRLDHIRGPRISLVPQDPASSLNPVRTIGAQLGEIFAIHHAVGGREIGERVLELLALVGFRDPGLRAKQYPHELSGGMRQRVLIAIAIALHPSLIIADEPTSALDVTVQKHILDLLDKLRVEFNTAVLLVTHDLGVAADRASRLVVMKDGKVQEQGETRRLMREPASAYTKRLLADAPSLSAFSGKAGTVSLTGTGGSLSGGKAADAIVAENLSQDFILAGQKKPFRALEDLSFRVPRGTTHALVGESGAGKTTAVRNVMGFLAPSRGRVIIDGVDAAALRGEERRLFRGKIQMVYQNPFMSLDPRQTVEEIVGEPLLNFEPVSKTRRRELVMDMLAKVQMPEELAPRRPHALSGGQRQRAAIARALILKPGALVLDEAVSALDVTVQAQILRLLGDLQKELNLSYLFVSHDLAVVRRIADTVTVLHDGKVMEQGPVEQVFLNPQNPYTRELIDAIPGKKALIREKSRPGPEPFFENHRNLNYEYHC